MSVSIDNRAVISPKAQLEDNVSVGPFAVIEDDVIIGCGTTIASNALIARGTQIGRECRIHHGAVLGTVPQDLKFQGEATTLEVGDRTTVREYATLNRGTTSRWKTVVGSDCYIMAYAHIPHDSVVGNHVILANSVAMGGHVLLEDYAILGGLVGVHQFVRIGCHTMIGAASYITKDIPPYVLIGSIPPAFNGLNSVGLRRRNFSKDTIENLEKAYKFIYSSRLNVSQAIERIKQELPMTAEIRHIVEFIKASKRGIIWKSR